MRNVDRPAEPESLVRSAAQWKADLLRAIKAEELNGSDANKRRTKNCRKRYNQRDVRQALQEMYGQVCCYCESSMKSASYGEIEHRKPKSKFPQFTFDWDNLHLACQVCNRNKGAKWDDSAPILDSVEDDVQEHLDYRMRPGAPKRHGLSARGTTTIEHAGLNRQGLLEERWSVFCGVMRITRSLRENPDGPNSEQVSKGLSELTRGQYGSYLEWIQDQDSATLPFQDC
ncbi:MAG: TIGR02646 family protein [Bacteroidota bacterium]|nr:TIGR02646 family protein [Bacteroidota bacterium]